jgi:hypothetical protein
MFRSKLRIRCNRLDLDRVIVLATIYTKDTGLDLWCVDM